MTLLHRTMLPKTIILSLILCLVATNGEPPAESSTVFNVNIKVQSESHQSIIQSYLSREFRALGDVKIVHNDGRQYDQYNVRVIHRHDPESKYHFYSFVVMRSVPEYQLGNARYLKGIGWIVDHGLSTFGSDIDEDCAEIVAHIDTTIFELSRAAMQLGNDIADELFDDSK